MIRNMLAHPKLCTYSIHFNDPQLKRSVTESLCRFVA